MAFFLGKFDVLLCVCYKLQYHELPCSQAQRNDVPFHKNSIAKLTKGKQVAVDGELRQDRWEKDGQKFSRVSIVANNVQLLGGKSEGGQNQMAGGAPRFQPRQDFSSMPTQSMPDYGDSFGDTGSDFPEDIPF